MRNLPMSLEAFVRWRLRRLRSTETHALTVEALQRDASHDVGKEPVKRLRDLLRERVAQGKLVAQDRKCQLPNRELYQPYPPELTERERPFVKHGMFPPKVRC